MSVTLETLELTGQELDQCREAVRKMAFLKWVEAGHPESNGAEFWLQAEREWIEHYYVPHRTAASPRCVSEEMGDQQSVSIPASRKLPGDRSGDRLPDAARSGPIQRKITKSTPQPTGK